MLLVDRYDARLSFDTMIDATLYSVFPLRPELLDSEDWSPSWFWVPFLICALIALDTLRLVRWRRQYETSISRLLQSVSGCENPLLMSDARDVKQVLARLKGAVRL